MKSNSKIILTVLCMILLSFSVIQSDGTIIKPDNPRIGGYTHTNISNTTIWDGLTGIKEYNSTIVVGSGGILQITNSNLNLTNTSNDTLTEYTIRVLDGGILEIHNSTVNFNSTSHGIFGGKGIGSSSSGYISIQDSTLSSQNADILHIEGDVNLIIDNVIFEYAGSDALDIINLQRDLTITNSIFRNNIGDGISIVMTGNYDVLLQNITTTNNGDEGLAINNVDTRVDLIDIEVSMNGDKGAEVASSNGVIHLNSSHIFGNYDDGFQFEGADDVVIYNSKFDQSGIGNPTGKHGLQVDGVLNTIILNSSFSDNTADGINFGGGNLVMENLLIENNGDEGIQYDGSFFERSISLDNITILNAFNGDGMKFRSVIGSINITNSLVEGGDDGVQIEGGASELTISNSVIRQNRESGVEIEDVGNFSISSTILTNNEVNGLEITSTHNAILEGLTLEGNFISGIDIVDSNVYLKNIDSSGNSGIPAGSNGLNIQGSNYTLISSNFNDNTGNGIVISQSSGQTTDISASNNGLSGISLQNSISSINMSEFSNNGDHGVHSSNTSFIFEFNTVNTNTNNGINLMFDTAFEIRNNTIMNNQYDGIYVSNSSIGIINYNTFGGNAGYAIEVAPRADGLIIDARYNYFGSDEGPLWNQIGNDGVDGVIGPLNVSLVLTSTGEIREFVPPIVENVFLGYTIQEIIVFLGILFIVLFVISAFIGSYYYQVWKETTNPRSILVISPSGLPVVEYHFQKSKADGALISGFLSAISSFGAEVVDKSTEGFRIREIAYDNFTILLDKVHTSMIAVVVDSSNFLIRRRVKQMALDIFDKYPELEPKPNSIFNISHLDNFDKVVEHHLREFINPEV